MREVFDGAFANVRSGLIVGPHDPTGRFTYWPVRVARGGEVLAPGDPGRVVQFVDARDLGAWLVHVAEQRIVGDFNASGEPRLTMGQLLETCRAVSGSEAELVWMGDEFLLGEGVGPWMELPLWLEPAEVRLPPGRRLARRRRRACASGRWRRRWPTHSRGRGRTVRRRRSRAGWRSARPA